MMKKNVYNIFTVLLIIGIMIFSMTACSKKSDTDSSVSDSVDVIAEDTDVTDVISEDILQSDSDTSWVLYWYLCGSDLESEGGAATTDLLELFDVQLQLPENVKIIIETGGTNYWQNDLISPDYLERYVYDSNGLTLIEQLPLASMGSEETLSDFLKFAKENYPADKTGFIFWNHGGGSVAGAAFDENFDYDCLTLDEMYGAFSANYEMSYENPPFDLIGFDTCLMATVDVAYTFCDVGSYLVASEETEPGNGWYYTGIGNALAANPQMDALTLGQVICDTYAEGCELVGTEDYITLSVVDLALVPDLINAYNDFGKEALANACIDPGFFSEFSRIAVSTENYGGNTKEQGYTNMADLGDLARKSMEMLPETSDSLVSVLDSCVVYHVSGPYRPESTGLSCYYSYNGDIDDFNKYTYLGAGEAFKYFYAYGLTGELSDEGMQYIAEMNYDSIPQLETLTDQGWDNHSLDVDDEGSAILTLGEKAAEVLSGIYIQLYYADLENDFMVLLGSDNDLFADWETGVFKDNFRGVWGGLNGNLVYMELAFEGDGYNSYNIPILLNGENYNLSVIYDFGIGAYEIQGAKKAIDENGMADKNLRYLVEGDVITTIHYFMSISGDDTDLLPEEVDEIIVDNSLNFEEISLGDGTFIQMFEMRDMQGNSVYSDTIVFEILDGTITTSVGY